MYACWVSGSMMPETWLTWPAKLFGADSTPKRSSLQQQQKENRKWFKMYNERMFYKVGPPLINDEEDCWNWVGPFPIEELLLLLLDDAPAPPRFVRGWIYYIRKFQRIKTWDNFYITIHTENLCASKIETIIFANHLNRLNSESVEDEITKQILNTIWAG